MKKINYKKEREKGMKKTHTKIISLERKDKELESHSLKCTLVI